MKARQTLRGSSDLSRVDRDQAGASAHSVLASSLVLRWQAQARSSEASGKGFHIGAMRQDQQDGKTEVTVEPKTASPPEPLAGEDYFCQDKLY